MENIKYKDTIGAKVTIRWVLPVYLVLPAGANRSQTINLIKENNGWPHQVSLIKSKHSKKDTLKLASKQDDTIRLQEESKSYKANWCAACVPPGQRAGVAAVQIHQPTCWGSLLLSSWKRKLSCLHDYTRWQVPVLPEFFLSPEDHRTNTP